MMQARPAKELLALGVESAHSEGELHSGLRIVIADDDEQMRLMLALLLEGHGHEVVGEAIDGAAAVSLSEQLRPDVITLDVDMPVLDGLSAARQIAAAQSTRIVIVSGWAALEGEAAAAEVGAHAFVPKADVSAVLPRAIDALVARSGDAT